ncbi:hypothetical protein ACMFMG_005266 [Clarireedia jacksonii]
MISKTRTNTQHPTSFESVSGVQERLATIEAHLDRLTISIARNIDREDPFISDSSHQGSIHGEQSRLENNDDSSEVSPSLTDNIISIETTQDQTGLADYSDEPRSLSDLCSQFRSHALASSSASESYLQLQNALQTLCDTAGAVEPFPPFGDHSLITPLSKQQAIAAVGHFFQHLDCTTDIFVQSDLLANLERVYSRPMGLGDDVWAICFKVITLLVLGMEISAQKTNALFGDFARSFLPSRAALVNSRLLTTPRLINVQTLILLSVAAQQFDPPGWAEFIFTYACMLARSMALHHAQLFPPHNSSNETLERAKVLRSLYSRDKSLCMTRGSVSWLPSYDCEIIDQLTADIELQAPYLNQCQLAMIQEEVYRFAHNISKPRRSTGAGLAAKSKAKKTLQLIEQHMDQYMREFAVFEAPATYDSCPSRAIATLEFLTTRIFALKHSNEPRHANQVRSDAKISCLLLLIAHGSQEPQVWADFKSMIEDTASPSKVTEEPMPHANAIPVPFASVLDAFSVPAFFILLSEIFQSKDETARSENDALNLLKKVSACYSNSTERMQSNSYHRRLAWIFEQILMIIDLIQNPQQHHSMTTPPQLFAAPVAQMSSSSHMPPPQAIDFFNVLNSPKECLSNFAFSPPATSTSFLWDNWSCTSGPMGGPATPFTSSNSLDISDSTGSDLLPESSTRKRSRTHDDPEALEKTRSMQNLISETLMSHDMQFDFQT